MKAIVDTRVDPGTRSTFRVLLEEQYEVMQVAGLDGRYGFSLSETPEQRSGLLSTIEAIYYIDENDRQVNLVEADITTFNLHENQFSCNYGDVDGNTILPGTSRNFRIGQIFVNASLLGKELTVKYYGLGSTVNALNLSPPIGYVYTQYPYCPSPRAMYPETKWEKMTDLYPELVGAFSRLEGGNASVFEEGVQEQSLANHQHNMESRSNGNLGTGSHVEGGWKGHSYRLSGGGEVRPINITVILWKRTR